MQSIYVMAIVTTAVAVATFGALFWQFAPDDRRRPWLVAVFAVGLLMSLAAYHLVRVPVLQNGIETHIGFADWPEPWKTIWALCRAPWTEEPAKLLPWGIVAVVAAFLSKDGWSTLAPSRRMAAPLALAMGLGFAVGEFWLVASFVAANPKMNEIPWWQFGGFLSERLMTCLSHTLFVIPTVWFARRGWAWACVGLLIGMTLHWLGNAPIVLLQTNAFGWGPAVWSQLVMLWVVAFAIAGLFLLVAVHFGFGMVKRILAHKMVCPECQAVYRQPIFLGLNAGTWRFEPCGHCKKWHWVTLTNLAPAGAPIGRPAENVGPPKPTRG